MTRVAVLNAGTATLKVAVMDVRANSANVEYRAEHGWSEGRDPEALVEAALGRIDASFDALGHRVVHGGAGFSAPVPIDSKVERRIEELAALAPLHNELALHGIRAARRRFPEIPSFAVFDTAFHARRPAASMSYALPPGLVEELALRRYGFHGIAHAALTESLAAQLRAAPSEVTAVTLQLGSGCSACAVREGRSIETSMGHTPLEGLVMATRSGDIDPAIVVHLARAGYTPDEIERLLNCRSGLLGLAGSSDVREILDAEERGDDRAGLALQVFVHRIVQTIGAYFTLLDGRGALVFGGGIGSHSAEIRRRVAEGLAAWGIELDAGLNTAGGPGRISRDGSRDVYALRTDEERLIARETAGLIDSLPGGTRPTAGP